MSIFTEDLEGQTWINYKGWTYVIPSEGVHRLKKASKGAQGSDGDILSPMPGQVLKLNVGDGDKVAEGQVLCVIEAMKMEHSLKAPFDGEIESLNCTVGDSVSLGDHLLSVKQKQ